ncbi:MAG: glycosyltransferase [Planctomycetes bacterium]|nr:glycosyltransferase [Planctomycetota bacterium]
MSRPRLAVVVSHPIQYFAPWYRAVARAGVLDQRVFFCCDWGTEGYRDPGFGIEVKWDIPLTEGYDHEFLPIARRPVRLRFREVDNPAVGEALDRFRPDVVLVYGYAHRTQWRAASWAKRRGVPVLLYSDSHGGVRPGPLKRALKALVVGRFYSMVSGALSVGENNAVYHLRYGVPRERLFPCVLPVETARFELGEEERLAARAATRARHGIPPEAFVVLFSGKLAEHKRPGDLLDASCLLGPGIVRFLLVGEGALRPALEARCREAGIGGVHFTGFVNQAQLPAVYAAGDLLAVPSSMDNHPLVIPEAGAMGIPVLLSDRVGSIGPTDSARPGVNALVHPCGDAAAIAAAVERLAGDRSLLSALSEGAREVVRHQTPERAAGCLADAVAALAGRRAPAAPRGRGGP